ncbi:hypothetical protein EVAR_5658_1 [Eumeta japonica]|uniref:Uncharacterized protein n=1 Tax=Eumeta variegata TaxID=151549 RepID=A0A4C1T768_EUMVA|nr:hypothetical protein EVAR_5658_1 [Eumeta japonica]
MVVYGSRDGLLRRQQFAEVKSPGSLRSGGGWRSLGGPASVTPRRVDNDTDDCKSARRRRATRREGDPTRDETLGNESRGRRVSKAIAIGRGLRRNGRGSPISPLSRGSSALRNVCRARLCPRAVFRPVSLSSEIIRLRRRPRRLGTEPGAVYATFGVAVGVANETAY